MVLFCFEGGFFLLALDEKAGDEEEYDEQQERKTVWVVLDDGRHRKTRASADPSLSGCG
jgi:hypothetical protein